MKLLLENWRKYLNEEDYRAGAMGTEATSEKEEFLDKFPELKQARSIADMHALALTILYPEQKPLFMDTTRGIPNGKFSSELMRFINSKGLEYAEAPNAQVGDKWDLYFIGTPENVRKAVELQNTPYIGIEELPYPKQFLEWVQQNRGKRGIVNVTPKFQKMMGILLGYGEENSKAFAEKATKPKWDEVYDHWQNTINIGPADSSETEIL